MSGMVVVGAGECGGRATLTLRELGYDGPITLIGRESYLPYERPPLSKKLMVATEQPIVPTVVSADHLAAQRISFLGRSRVAGIARTEKQVRLDDGRIIAYDKLLLATGAIPREFPLAVSGRSIAYFRTFDDVLALRSQVGVGRRIAVIGGGFIGLELAAAASQSGTEVVVIESQSRILMRGVTAEIAATIHRLHDAHGVEIVCGDRIIDLTSSANSVGIRLLSGRVVRADFLVVGIGVTPATALAESVGLAVEDGVSVDACLQTSDANIFAAGDCCSFPLSIYGGRRVRLESWRNAHEQGPLAARNMLGAEARHVGVPWFWSDQYDMTLQVAGLVDEGTTTIRRDLSEESYILFHLSTDGRLVAASGIGPGNAAAKEIRLAEILIARQARPEPLELASPHTNLKKLLVA